MAPTAAVSRHAENNCCAIGELTATHQADVVCLQECDAASWWSGSFDHAKTIGKAGKMAQLVRGLNVDGAGLHYGTALLSRFALTDAAAHTFRPTPPTFTKGITIASMSWPGDDAFDFDIVSVHLDFASAGARQDQTNELITLLNRRGKPMIVVGDFNSNWDTDTATRQLASALDLAAFEPNADMVTFPFTGERLDWVLVSAEFEIASVEAIDAKLSDHRPLRAVIQRADGRPE